MTSKECFNGVSKTTSLNSVPKNWLHHLLHGFIWTDHSKSVETGNCLPPRALLRTFGHGSLTRQMDEDPVHF